MNQVGRFRTIRIAVFFTLIFAGHHTEQWSVADEAQVPMNVARAQVEPFINWFPGDIESLIVVRLSSEIAQVRRVIGDTAYFGADTRETFIDAVFDRPSLRGKLAGKAVKWWIEGAGRFRVSKVQGTDSLLSDGCVILVFNSEDCEFEKGLFREMQSLGAKKFELLGATVVNYIPARLKQRSNRSSYWLAAPIPGVLMVCTSERIMKEMLGKISCPDKLALPETLSQWRVIDLGAPVWGMRNYRQCSNEVDLDISDGRLADGVGVVGKSDGFAFQYSAKSEFAEVVWTGCDRRMMELIEKSVRSRVCGDGEIVQIKLQGDGEVGIQVQWPRNRIVEDQVVRRRIRFGLESYLLWHLGHAGFL